ncbi:hypothetical protein BO94DRAFT_75985 [Aspergillus sclerotioniger CBS 115572]|uniref:Uncharacterized protein n=1 Tax=Aspergillus sclerotioniger CBS 115572 TaxID=1450535 RepID=A0A317WR05_9EURO|nr:hypothetical protein BO94DRAFT_75985 [Aspergillus sclerotioniger CBS 115572]PWY87348.1 hypothetical protein BO94DRAFT_75985 [Aspergillus sclerotioniger CBS 115572]
MHVAGILQVQSYCYYFCTGCLGIIFHLALMTILHTHTPALSSCSYQRYEYHDRNLIALLPSSFLPTSLFQHHHTNHCICPNQDPHSIDCLRRNYCSTEIDTL